MKIPTARRLGALLVTAGLVAACSSTTADEAAPEPEASEEVVADAQWWNHETGGDGWGNQELQYYVDGGNAAALDGDGHLVITAAEGQPDSGICWYGECRYTSARITTRCYPRAKR